MKPSNLKQFTVGLLITVMVMLPCRQAPAPLPLPFVVALKCLAAAGIGAAGVIIWNCDSDYYLVRYKSDDQDTYWGVSKANPRTLSKTGGRRCEGPSKDRKELDFRAWVNNQDPEFPMFPCGPLGSTLPAPTRTNYSVVDIQHTFNGGNQWRPAARGVVDLSDNWSVVLLGPVGASSMTSDELRQVAEADIVVTNALPYPDAIKAYDVRGWLTEAPSGRVSDRPVKTPGQF